jgi:hypothetical protein
MQMGHIQPAADQDRAQAQLPTLANQEQTAALLQQLMQQVNPQLQQVYEINQEKEKEKSRWKKDDEKDEAGVKLYKIHAGGQERQAKYLQVMNFIKQNQPKKVSQTIAAKSHIQKMKASEFVKP